MHSIKKLQCIFFLSSIFYFGLHQLHSQVAGRFLFDTIKLKNWPLIHSFAFGKYGEYVLMLGGRTDGIHEKESGFENTKSNSNIYLWNTLNDSIIQYKPDSLNAELTDYLNAANANFIQDSQSLYIMGGYGQSKSGIYKTYPLFLKINFKDCIERILLNKDISPTIKYIVSDQFAVAGAQLRIMDSLFYLVGGHKFDGKYSVDDHSITQKYTDALRIIKFFESGDTLQYALIKEITNDAVFHRRDYNVNPIIDRNGEIKLMVLSGVFQYNVARAFLNTALIQNQNYEEIFDFEHKYAAYNCARIGMFDHTKNEMHQLFFGGMAEYYRDSINAISRDGYVPFVKSVSSITRKNDGSFLEYLYPEELPGYFGTNSEFLLNPEIKIIYEDIIDLNSIQNDTTCIGTIFGGIYNPSEYRNPWQIDSAHLTKSNPYHLKVYFIKDKTTASKKIEDHEDTTEVVLIPNPANKQFRLIFSKELTINSLDLWIQDTQGRMIKTFRFKELSNNELTLSTKDLVPQNYSLYLSMNGNRPLKKQLIISR